MRTPEPKNIRYEVADGIATLAIDRPHVLNAIDDPTVLAIIQVMDAIAADPSIRALIFASGEKAFCSGSDLDEAVEATVHLHRYHWEIGQQLLDRIEDLPIPVIAAVHGWAMGGGSEIALACDIRIASEDAKFGFPEITIGAIPSWGGTQRLPWIVGRGHALELLLSGIPIAAERALAIGLVNRVVPVGEEYAAAVELATVLAERPPTAVRAAKSLVRASAHATRLEGEALEVEWNLKNVADPEFERRVSSFLSRRGSK